MKDGLCHHCQKRRNLIQIIHQHFPETNPEIEQKEDFSSWHLDLWKPNPPKYPKAEVLLKKFDRLHDHDLRNNEEKRKAFDEVAENLNALEQHFRLSQAYLRRARKIEEDFCSVLGKEWVRIIHDSKNPLVIGHGGVHGAETAVQKRNLAICACVGTLIEYADPDGGKPPATAIVSNLSLNKDKNS